MSALLPTDQIWTSLFGLGHLSIAEKMIRPIMIYAFLVVGLRLAGKRELAQMNPLDLIVLLTLSNTVQNAIIGNDDSVIGGVIGATTLLAANYCLNRYVYRHPKADHLLNGEPVALVENGHVREENLAREMITLQELQAVIRKQGLRNLDEVESALLETSGVISVGMKTPTPDEITFSRFGAQLDRIEAMLKASLR